MKRSFTALAAFFLCSCCSYFVSAQTLHPDYWDGQFFLKIKLDSPEKPPLFELTKTQPVVLPFATNPVWTRWISEYDIQSVSKPFTVKDPHLQAWHLIKFNRPELIDRFMNEVRAQGFTLTVEKNPIFRTVSLPNDVDIRQWSLYRTNALEAWNLNKGNKNIKVAIVDDAVRITHDDLAPNTWVNPGETPNNGIDDDNNGYIDDVNGYDVADNDPDPNPPANASDFNFTHGTHCAGIASAATNNGVGVASVGYGVSILPVKSTRDEGDPRFIEFGYRGVDYAIRAGANVISMSWGSAQGGGNVMEDLFRTANQRGIVLVAAAGNDNTSRQFFPAAAEYVISVGSTDRNDRKSGFSNYGDWIDIMAPGSDIYSTLAGGDGSYGYQSGTSMAGPMVAGLVGLMLSYNPKLTPEEVLNCLTKGADNIDASNPELIGRLGAGRINCFNSVNCLPPQKLENDLNAAYFSAPARFTCNSDVYPRVILANPSKNVIRSAQIFYRVGTEEYQNFTWRGVLDTNATVEVELPFISIPENRTAEVFKIKLYTALPNGVPDPNPVNDTAEVVFTVLPPFRTLPFREGFETRSFATNRWSVDNPDERMGWATSLAQGLPGSRIAARVNCFRYPDPGQRDGLVTPPLYLGNRQNIALDFRHAYRRRSRENRDSLLICISNDCGATFRNIFRNGGGEGFATGNIIGENNFIPERGSDWCGPDNTQECFQVNLSSFRGQTVILKFEIFNAFGNNIYIDNINISGSDEQPVNQPAAQFTSDRTSVCGGSTISFTNQSLNYSRVRWTFERGTPATSDEVHPTVRFDGSGPVNVQLIAYSASGDSSIINKNIISVIAPPDLTVSPAEPLVCKGSSVLLTAEGAQTYFWEPAVGLSADSGKEISARPETTTEYTVTGLNRQGCRSTKTVTVRVSDESAEPLVVTSEKTTVCPGETVVLTVAGSGNFTWSPSGTLNQTTGLTVTARPVQTTTYEVFSGSSGSCVSSGKITITVPDLKLNLSRKSVFHCPDSNTTAFIKGAERYEFTPSEGIQLVRDSILQLSPAQTVTYTVTGIIGECRVTDTLRVEVSTLTARAEADRRFIDIGRESGLVRFRDVSGPVASRYWDFADGGSSTLPNPTRNFRNPGVYRVSLTVNDNTCGDTAVVVITVVRTTSRPDVDEPNSAFQLYPNPTEEVLFIRRNGPASWGETELKLYDLSGREVYRSILEFDSEDRAMISVHNIGSGVYRAVISGDSFRKSQAVVITE